MTFLFWFTIGVITGVLFIVLILSLCKTSARCSAREQAAMDDEQVREISGAEKWAAKLAPTFRDGLGLMEEDDDDRQN